MLSRICIFLLILLQKLVASSDIQNEAFATAMYRSFSTPPGVDSIVAEVFDSDSKSKVETENGVLLGAALPEAHSFFSVPYAASPAADKRFLSPTPANDYPNGTLDVSIADGLACYQPSSECQQGLCFDNLSEDCLVLNVYVPSSVDLSDHTVPPSERLPVLFWLHGGGLLTGSGTSPIYDGRYLSNATNTIVVTINYRLGAFGFLVFEEDGVIHKNQGFQDQQMALTWVQSNIEAFGGDKEKVTLFGNSAGAQSVMFHLMSKISEPLFRRAILQSNPAIFHYPSLNEAQLITNKVLNNTDCAQDYVSCLRDVDATTLVRQGNILRLSSITEANLFATVEPFGLVLDGQEFDQNPIQFVQSGRWLEGKEVLMGTNIDEMIFVPLYIPDIGLLESKAFFEGVLKYAFGEDVGQMLADEYEKEATRETDYTVLLGQLITDGFFICPVRQLARFASKHTNSYLYSYAYAMNDSSCDEAWKPAGVCGNVFHSAENSFVFRSAPLIPYNFSADDMFAVNQFSAFWGNFAYSGNPSLGNASSLGDVLEWPMYQSSDSIFWNSDDKAISRVSDPWLNYVIDSPNGRMESNYHSDICDFWDSTKYYIDLDKNPTTTATTESNEVTSVSHSSTDMEVNTKSESPLEQTTLDSVMQTTTGEASIRCQSSIFSILAMLLFAILVTH